jgi:hypothetical protein
MMLHVQGVRVPFLPVPHHVFNLLGPVCAEYVVRLTSFIQYKAWRIKFYFTYHLSPLSPTFGDRNYTAMRTHVQRSVHLSALLIT